MAKKRKKDDREVSTLRYAVVRPTYVKKPSVVLTEIEDNRTFEPARTFKPARVFSGRPARYEVRRKSDSPLRLRSSPAATIAFKDPRSVLVCIRRHQRRQVLFAKNRIKSGAGTRRRRTEWSDITC